MEVGRRSPIAENIAGRLELLKFKLDRLVKQKSLYWRQRAKVHWLEHCDRNAKFFHKYASERRRRNRMRRLVLDDGRTVNQEGEMLAALTNFYTELFTSHADGNTDELLQCVLPRVTSNMNEVLIKYFSDEEIKLGLDSIGNLKAPGYDGMSAIFYTTYWGTIGDDIIREVKNFLNGGQTPEAWNDTVVVLIPKINNPERLGPLVFVM